MGEPEHRNMHNFQYHPGVANWVHSTSLAHLDGTSDEPQDQSPDDFYRSSYTRPDVFDAGPLDDMTSTRQRQQSSNGVVRSNPKPKPSVRSVSGPAASMAATRAAQLPVNRPTVRSLAQRFNQPPSVESSPPSTRVRTSRATSSSTKSITEVAAPSASITSSPARPAREATYGNHKFNNLKPRDRPQPAPASPASVRRGERTSREEQTTPSRRKLSSPTRGQAQRISVSRLPFFGEVVGEHDQATPGFGIPNADPASTDGDPIKLPVQERSTIKLVTDDSNLSPKASNFGYSPIHHGRSTSEMISTTTADGQPVQRLETFQQREARRASPPSRIPVATRRVSVASDSSSSNRSLKFGTAGQNYRRTSPTHNNENTLLRKPVPSAHQTLPAVSYRGYRERGKSPQARGAGTSLAVVISAPPAPTSPRLRNSRERHLATLERCSPTIRSVDAHDHGDYFQEEDGPKVHPEPHDQNQLTHALEGEGNSFTEHAKESIDLQVEQPTNENSANPSLPYHKHHHHHQQSLSLHTSSLLVPPVPAPLSATTDFEQDESPILGMPGGFVMTPPIAQYTPPVGSEEENGAQASTAISQPEELLQARAFRPLGQTQTRTRTAPAPSSEVSTATPSGFGLRESIPIMLGADEQQPEWAASMNRAGHSPRLSIGAHQWRTVPLDSSGAISFLEEDDSPTDPFANRDSLRPDDSASVAFYQQAERRAPDWTPKMPAMSESSRMTMDSEAYSVINRVLSLYHQSSVITPEVAYNSQKQVHGVSPVIAQHEDWGSKEATETYLARLLSDATVLEERNDHVEPPAARGTGRAAAHYKVPSLSILELDEDPSEHSGGTAIIFPPESRRYSRGSRGSTTTTICEDGSRADSSSVNLARDLARAGDDDLAAQHHPPPSTYAPHPPPKEWQSGYSEETFHSTDVQPHTHLEQLPPSFGSLLPEIEGTGEGLGLSLHADQQQESPPPPAFQHPPPPRPAYSPPPPPVQPSIERTAETAAPYTPSVYNRQSPSSTNAKMGNTFSSNPYERLDDACDDGSPLPGENNASDKADLQDGANAPDATPPSDSNGAATVSATAGITLLNVDPVTQMLRQRYRIIEEMISSEQLFCVDMMLASTVFEQTAGEALDPKEIKTLFCNSGEIDKFSHNLFQNLKRAARPIANPEKSPEQLQKQLAMIKRGENVPDETEESLLQQLDRPFDPFAYLSVEHDRMTNIGQVMQECLPKLERLFTTYLLNHGDASELIKAKADSPEVLGWVKTCFVHSKDVTNAWDLDSLLVKPVQRVMKYPLLLDSLEKATAADHPDFAAIQAARKEIVEINLRINQARNRQETLREATKEGKKQKNKGLLEKGLGKNFFVKKPFASKSADRTKPQSSAAAAFSDDEYDFLSQKFGGHFFQIQVVIRDIEAYLDAMSEFMCNTNCLVITFIALMESAPSSHPEIESTWRRQAMAFFELQNVALEDHKATVRQRVLKPILELWALHGRPQKLMEQRKKGLAQYIKYRQSLERKDKIDPKVDEAGQAFAAINATLKLELPKLYDLTKKCVRACLGSFSSLQKDWWKNCQKKLLPMLECEPEHTTSISHDLKAYVDRFYSDFATVEAHTERLAIANNQLLQDMQNYASPVPIYPDDTHSRKSSSRRTESMSSDASLLDPKKRYSGSHSSQRTLIYPARSSPAMQASYARERAERRLSPGSERSEATVTHGRGKAPAQYPNLDGAFDHDYPPTSSMGSSLLSPTSNPGSSRTSGVFNSALPMSDSAFYGTREEAPTSPASPMDADEPEVLFLAASLFEFNIAHDRREGGIPYLVYVPGEIFDVIGMKGELWLARNQDDSTRTVGWIWEKHFARILPEDG
ncbi:hypothetical protein K504DRAFT_454611 [Pleomassaria siparia CBS 279.74]|uniref:DH domain-containing protein n=1 Tax=Pleomassaria siparia CBS 279.74 TaxID=1314801 RepID=A0A6G1KCC8_9PLEO|nr:hypothetical protein K504DRAFT_454611 [Pleomassaria siparia CBS 279.74]